MDKLLDVNRQGGFPITTEVLETFNSRSEYIEELTTGLFTSVQRQQHGGVAVWLNGYIRATKMLVLDAKDGLGSNPKIVKMSTKIPLGSNFPTYANMKKGGYALKNISKKMNIYKQSTTSEVYPDAILQEEYEIILADQNNPAWEVMTMSELIHGEWVGIGFDELGFDREVEDIGSVIRYNNKQRILDVQLCFYVYIDSSTNIHIDIPRAGMTIKSGILYCPLSVVSISYPAPDAIIVSNSTTNTTRLIVSVPTPPEATEQTILIKGLMNY
jgi:hypothetical protein